MTGGTTVRRCCGAVALALVLAGCAGTGKERDTGGGGRGAGGAPAATPITGTDWVLVELAGGSGVLPAERSARPTLRLDAQEKRASGSTGVNNFTGSYELTGEALQFGSLATTRRAGAGELMRRETAYLDALKRTARARVSGSSLRLFDAGGNLLARFEPRKPLA